MSLFLCAQRDESDGYLYIFMSQSLFEPWIKQRLLSATETGLVGNIVPR